MASEDMKGGAATEPMFHDVNGEYGPDIIESLCMQCEEQVSLSQLLRLLMGSLLIATCDHIGNDTTAPGACAVLQGDRFDVL